jgi:hypothetical protein
VNGFVSSALLVENAIPAGSTWDGSDRPVPIRETASASAVPTGGASDR